VREFTAARTLCIPGRLDARVPQHAMRVLQRPVLLHVGSQRPPHHLEGDEAVRNTQLPSAKSSEVDF
jgi:hypothetical protein